MGLVRTLLSGALKVIAVVAIAGWLSVNSQAQSLGNNLPNPYKEVENWARMPEGMRLSGAIYAPGVDSRGNVWVLWRCGLSSCTDSNEPALLEFDKSGNFIKGIGRGLFAFPHGLFVDKDDNLWVADCGASKGKGNQVTKLSPDGKVLLTLGKKGVMGGSPDNFIGPSSVLVAPNGDIFVTDGHAVAATGGGGSYGFDAKTSDPTHMRIAKFSKDGKFLKGWGRQGSGKGEFIVPHGLAMDSQGRLFVADRGNNRIQIFDQDGNFLDEWKQFGKPVSIYIDNHDMLYAIDSDSIANLWDWKYSSVGKPCADCLVRVPRLTDVGADNPDFTQGIRIGSVKDGVVRAYVPSAHFGPYGPRSLPEYLVTDADGNMFVAEPRTEHLRKYVKKIELPEGAGKEHVERACGLCHDFEEFKRVNYDRDEWMAVVKTMAAGGAPLKPEEIPATAEYLANAFKPANVPGVTVPGLAQATIEEWDLPTPNSMPTSIYQSKVNGFAWYTAPFADVIGRFDPKTHEFKEFHARPGTNPISISEYGAHNFMGTGYFVPQTGNFIGEFHPVDGPYSHWKQGDVMEHPIEGSRLRFHQVVISKYPQGIWFTAGEGQAPLFDGGSKIGRMIPWSTDIQWVDTPTPHADPDAIAVSNGSVPYFIERNSARIGTVNPESFQASEFVLPNADSAPRGITVTPDDLVYYTDYARGYLGKLDPKTGKFQEWASPSGEKSRPYGITNVDGVIWYAESGTKPNMLVRFDPKTQKFQSWPVKDGGGIRQISTAPDGSLWFTRPMSNGIAHVTIRERYASKRAQSSRQVFRCRCMEKMWVSRGKMRKRNRGVLVDSVASLR